MKKLLLFALLMCGLFTAVNAQCPAGQVEVEIDITPDNYPNEVTWELRNASTNMLIAQGNVNDQAVCYTAGTCLKFTIFDSAGDGLCCAYGAGSYEVRVNGVVQASGGSYGAQEQTLINCPPGQSCGNPLAANTGSFTAPQADTWYIFNPDSIGSYTISTCGNTCDTKIWVYDHCLGLVFDNTNIGTAFYNDDNGVCNLQAIVTGILDTAETYYIRIGQYNTSCGSNPISWSLTFDGPVSGCTNPASCNYNPLATVDDGSCVFAPSPLCPSPDLMIVESTIQSSLQLDNIGSSNCTVQEGCLTGYGTRDILRFTTHIKNIGSEDYYIGNPANSPTQFTFDNCHGHWHYVGYAAYLLYDMQGNEIPIGFKNGFCVLDLECSGGGNAQYGCGNMGISSGCGDIYGAGLDCQWIDLTDVDTGVYQLVVKVNWDQSPDALGHYETDYTNNWASVCIHYTRGVTGIPNFSVIPNCADFVDCLGVTYGNAVTDCNGDCNGSAVRGDMNIDSSLTQQDAVIYVDEIIDNTITLTTCNDMNADGENTVFDAALINNCLLNSSQVNDPCEFPFGITNIYDTATVSISNVNFAQNYVDISIRNPLHKVVAYQFTMRGIEIQSVQNLVSPLEYNITPDFAVNGTEVIGISYQQMLIDKNTTDDALCRIYFSAITDTVICIDQIIDVVNEDYEAMHTVIGGTCAMVPNTTGLQNSSNGAIAVNIFPNPTSGMINLNISLANEEDLSIEIADGLGRVVMTESVQDVTFRLVTMDMSALANGVYTVSLKTAAGKLTQRVILNK